MKRFPRWSFGKGSGEPLGGHLTAAVKVKIGKGECMDAFSLLYRELEPKTVQQGVIVIKEQEEYKHPNLAKTFNMWLPHIYTSYLEVWAEPF